MKLTAAQRRALHTLAEAWPLDHLARRVPLRDEDQLVELGLARWDGLYGHYLVLTDAGLDLARKEGMTP